MLDMQSKDWAAIGISLAANLAGWIVAILTTRRIVQSVSTRYVGKFPTHLSEIASLVSSAHRQILIFGDSVDYGSYGRPAIHNDYMEALLNALERGRDVRHLIWGPPAAFSKANKQNLFGKPMRRFLKHLGENKYAFVKPHPAEAAKSILVRLHRKIWTAITGPRRTKKRIFIDELDNIHSACQNGKDDRFANGQELAAVKTDDMRRCLRNCEWLDTEEDKRIRLALMLCLHEWVKEIYEDAGAQIIIRKDQQSPELFFWIIDGAQAIFLLPTGEKDALAFFTKDRHLVKTFKRIFRDKEKATDQTTVRK